MKYNKRSIIIDTDAGHDDVLAMIFLLKYPKVAIRAITTVAGNSTIENVTRNAQYVLDLMNQKSIPIYSGASSPMSRPLIQAIVHGPSGLAGADTSKTQFSMTNNADDQIIRIVRNNPHTSIVTLGPLTNIARALQKDPELSKHIETLVIMGGAIDVCGNKNRVAEFNMFVDPEAADKVFRSKIHKVLIPLDPCNKVILQLSFFRQLREKSFYPQLISMMKHFIHGIYGDEGVRGALVYDAIAAYYLAYPQAFVLKPMDVVVETKGEHTSGMTVAEKRRNKPIHANIEVAFSVDAEKFKSDFIRIISN